MTQQTQSDVPPNKAEVLRQLLTGPEILVTPCPYDALSAKLAVEAQFKALFVGGYAAAAARFASPDIGLMSQTEMLETARSVIRAAEGVPVLVDGDTGYGEAANIRRTILDLAQAGAAAVMIEDQVWPKRCGHLDGKMVVPRTEAVGRIEAAVRASEETGNRILIVARTDARDCEGLDEALTRVRAFADVGADVLFMESPATEREMEAFVGSTNRPTLANMLPGGKTPILPPARLQEIGFAMAVYPISLLGAAAAAVRSSLAALRDNSEPPLGMSHGELLELTGYEDLG